LVLSFIFGISGTFISFLIRIELYSSGNRIISPENQNFYNVSITLHGIIMIFFLVMPGLFGGFGNYFAPIFQGSPEVVYPRINNFSVFVLILSYILLICSFIIEFGGGVGWTIYPPLSTSYISLSPSSVLYIILALLVSGMSSCFTSLNFVVVIINIRVYSLSLSLLSLFSYSLFITSCLLLLTLPVLSSSLILLISDLYFNSFVFDPIFGGDPVLYQHLFWFFGHPEVYILIIPAFGFISIIISSVIQKIIFGNQSMIFAMSSISILGSLVWGHHMYVVGLESDTRSYFVTITIFISLPTGTKIFNWLSIYLSSFNILSIFYSFNIFLIYVFLFLIMFTIGGSTGVILGNSVVDLVLHDTYYVVAHFHFVLSLGAVISILSSIYYSSNYLFISRSILPSCISFLSYYQFIILFFGILSLFLPMHFLGFNVMARRIPDYPDSFHS